MKCKNITHGEVECHATYDIDKVIYKCPHCGLQFKEDTIVDSEPPTSSRSSVADCYSFKDSDGKRLERDTWYWVASPNEGDIWYPINVQEMGYLMDGNIRYNFEELKDLVIKKASLPEWL